MCNLREWVTFKVHQVKGRKGPSMQTLKFFLTQVCLSVCATLLLACSASAGEIGVLKDRLVIGQVIGLSGPTASSVKEQIAGSKLVLDDVNRKGGIFGRKIDLITRDDAFVPAQTASVTTELIATEKPLALFFFRGAAQLSAALPVIDAAGIPLIAPSAGAMNFHSPPLKHVFMLRAPFQYEVRKAVKHLATVGINRVAIFYSEDGLGLDANEGFREAVANEKIQVLVSRAYKRPLKDLQKIAQPFIDPKIQAIFVIGAPDESSAFITTVRKLGVRSQIVTLSNNASSSFIRGLGEYSNDIIVTQVIPARRSGAISAIDDFQKLAAPAKIDASDAAMEGYLAAKLLVDALTRAGRNVSRPRLLETLNGMSSIDLGGIRFGYGPTDHTGMEAVELSIIAKNGKFVR